MKCLLLSVFSSSKLNPLGAMDSFPNTCLKCLEVHAPITLRRGRVLVSFCAIQLSCQRNNVFKSLKTDQLQTLKKIPAQVTVLFQKNKRACSRESFK